VESAALGPLGLPLGLGFLEVVTRHQVLGLFRKGRPAP
jgi:hypothetical protein